VTFQDLAGMRHTVEVEADSVYEAACIALRALKKAAFVEQPPGAASKLQVQVLEPAVIHEVTVGQVKAWLESGGTNPNEQARKRRLKELLRA
jgi:hypothetical protein